MSDVRKCDICGRTQFAPDDIRWGVLIVQAIEWTEFDVCPACIDVLMRIPTYEFVEDCNKLATKFKIQMEGDG